MPTQTFTAQFKSLDAIREFVAREARSAGLDEKEVYRVQLAADEAASNVMEHAYLGMTDGQIEISAQVLDDAFQIVLRDQGRPFDPQEIDEPDIAAPLEERVVGGLGLLFMRKLMDELYFAYAPESGNTLTMIKRLPAGSKTLKSRRSNWRGLLFGLGDHILAATTFAVQHDVLLETISRLVPDAEAGLWLDEPYFRLPD